MREKLLLAIATMAGAGCAATSGMTANSGEETPVRPAATKAPAAHPAARRHARGHAGQLRVGTASSTVVQRQPPPRSCHARGRGLLALPDPQCTGGATSRAVTQANIHSTICVRGYTKTVRPRESITEPEKLGSMDAYGDAGSPHDYEYDHLVSLELGGALNDARNLWPEPGRSPNPKDRLENRLHELICAGRLSLWAAQHQIATNWVAAYHRLFG